MESKERISRRNFLATGAAATATVAAAGFPFVQAASTVVMIMLPMALLLVANHIKDEKTLKLLVGIMIVAGVLGIPRQFFGIRVIPTNTGGLYTMWVILFSAALGLFNRQLTNWQRALTVGFVAN